MTHILWLVLVLGYGLFTWAAGKFSKAALSFLDGGYLAFLCFAVLPHAMGMEHFFLAAGAAGIGVTAALFLEGKKKLPPLVFAIVTGCQLFWSEPLSLREILFLAFFGGMGLYFLSMSRLVIAISDRIIWVVKYIVVLFFRILSTPFRLVWLLIRKPLQKIRGFCGKQRKKLLQSTKLYVKMKLHHLRIDWKIFRRRKE